MLSWEIHLSHQREKNPSSHLVRSMQRSEREAPVKCFFCGWKLGGLQMKRETLSGEVIHPRRVVWEITFFLFKLVLGRPWSSLFYPFLSFRRLKVDKQVKSRAADSQAVEKIGCDTSPSRAATQLHPPSKVRRVKGFSLTLEPPTFGRLVQAQNPSNPTIHRSFFLFLQVIGLNDDSIWASVFLGIIPRQLDLHCVPRDSDWDESPGFPKMLWSNTSSRRTRNCLKMHCVSETHSCYSDLCWLTQHVLVGWQNQRLETLKCPNPEGVTVKSQTLRTL